MVKNILISQPEPADYTKSPYKPIADKFGLNLKFKKLFNVEGITGIEFRKQRINILDYTAVVLTSRNAVDHYFRMAREMRVTIPISMKFLCNSESVAYYIQTYMQFRKRKIFFGKQTTADLMEVVAKHKDEKFLFPCSEDSGSDVPAAFAKAKLALKVAPMYRSVPAKVARELSISNFDMILMFSPIGVKSLFENYPTFRQGKTLIGVHGHGVADAAMQAGLKVNLYAPTPHSTSMSDALGEFLTDLSKHGWDVTKVAPYFEYRPDAVKEEAAAKEKAGGAKAEADKNKKSETPARSLEKKMAANKAAAMAVMAARKAEAKRQTEELARKRSEASKKAAATRKAKLEAERKAAEELARKRSEASKKAAATRKAKKEAARKAAEELARKRSEAAKKAAATRKAKQATSQGVRTSRSASTPKASQKKK